MYQVELRLSSSQQLADGLRVGRHQVTDLHVIVMALELPTLTINAKEKNRRTPP